MRKNFGVLIKVFAVSFSTGSYFSRLLFCTVFFICFLFFGRGYVQDGFFRFTRGEFFFRLKDWYLFLSLFFVRNYWFWFFINSHFVFILAFFCMCSLFGAFGRTIGFRRRFVKSLFYLCHRFYNTWVGFRLYFKDSKNNGFLALFSVFVFFRFREFFFIFAF